MIVHLLRVAGLVHLVIIAANFVVPARLDFRGNLNRVDPIVRQIFVVHHAYIVGVLALFAGLCLFFPADLAGASRLGRVLCGFMAFFWLLRLPIQFFYYDDEVKRRNPAEHWAFSFAVASLAAVLSAAAWGVGI